MLASSKIVRTGEREGDLTSLHAMLGMHLRAVDRFLEAEISSFEPEIREMAAYCLGARGKRIRASLVFLGGWRGPEAMSDDLVRVAAVVELVHLATLVHDDILDEASTRHNRATAARRFGSDIAVLLGDALFAQAVTLSTRFPTTDVCRHVAVATRRVCAGEISQTLRASEKSLTEADYFRIIELKTAELFRVSCFLGARLGRFRDTFVEAAGVYGSELGIAYQMYDDLVDIFGNETAAGKTLGTDWESGKLTLPAILLGEMDGADALNASAQSGWAATMVERGIFADVVGRIRARLAAADAALEGQGDLPPTPVLLEMTARLLRQIEELEESVTAAEG